MRKHRKYILITICVICCIFVITSGFTYAKYVANSVWNYYLNSNGFYFESEDLSVNEKKNINNNWDGSSTYFTISNSSNDSLITEYDINYKVTCTLEEEYDSVECLMNGSTSNIYEGVLSSYSYCYDRENELNVDLYSKSTCENGGYTWIKQKTEKELYFDIVNNSEDEISSYNVNIVVESTNPYSKKLLGKYILNKGISDIGSLNLNYTSFDDYDNVVVTNTYTEDKCVKLSWDSNNLRIDVNKDNISSYETDTNGYINEIVFKLNSSSNMSYIFYKTDINKSYTFEDFTLVENSEC